MKSENFSKFLQEILKFILIVYSPIFDRGPHYNTLYDKIILLSSIWFVSLLPLIVFLIFLYITYIIGFFIIPMYIIGIILFPVQFLLVMVSIFLTYGVIG